MSNEELVQAYQEGNKQALTDLVINNKGLVYNVAYKIKEKSYKDHIELDDLTQEGYLALINAAKLFNSDMNIKFTTYLVKSMSRKMYEYIFGASSKDKGNIKFIEQSKSLNTPVDEEGRELVELVADPGEPMQVVEDDLYNTQLHNDLYTVMRQVNTEQEIKAIEYQYYHNKSYEEVAEQLNITCYEYRKLRNKALNKIRKAVNKTVLKEYKPPVRYRHFNSIMLLMR